MLQDVNEHEEVVLQKNKKIYNIVLSIMIALMFPLGAVFLYLNIGDTRGLLPQEQLASATQMNRGSNGSGDDLAGHDIAAA